MQRVGNSPRRNPKNKDRTMKINRPSKLNKKPPIFENIEPGEVFIDGLIGEGNPCMKIAPILKYHNAVDLVTGKLFSINNKDEIYKLECELKIYGEKE